MDCFCVPATASIGGCEQKDKRKLMGGGPNDGVNVAMGTSGPAVAVEKAYRLITTLSFAREKLKRIF
jgi:hypothetical protein